MQLLATNCYINSLTLKKVFIFKRKIALLSFLINFCNQFFFSFDFTQ